MRFRALYALLLILAVLVAVTLVYRVGKRPLGTRRLLSDLGSVEKIVFTKGDSVVTLALAGGDWRLVSPIEALANQSAVGEFVDALSKVELGEVVTTRPETYVDYGVDGETEGRIFLQSASDTFSFVIGKLSGTGEGYVRLSREDAVYLGKNVTGRLTARGLDRWRNRLILAVPKAAIERIEFAYASRKHSLERGEGKWIFDGAAVDSTTVAPIFVGLESLQADGFLYDDEFEPEWSILIELRDGRQETIFIGQEVEGRAPVMHEGDETIFLVSSWKLDRLKEVEDSD